MNRRKFLKAVLGGMVAAALPKLPAMGGSVKAGQMLLVGGLGCDYFIPAPTHAAALDLAISMQLLDAESVTAALKALSDKLVMVNVRRVYP